MPCPLPPLRKTAPLDRRSVLALLASLGAGCGGGGGGGSDSGSAAPMGSPRRADEVPLSDLGLPLLAGALPAGGQTMAPAAGGVQTTALAPPPAAPAAPARATP